MQTTSDGEDRPWQSYHTAYTNAKAGMDGVNKEEVQRIVYEMSKGSKYFENEEKKKALIHQKVVNLRAKCAELTEAEIASFQMIADRKIVELEASRDLSRMWLHIDMDAFYAAVETLINPLLNGKPVAVGSLSMISTANYEARRFGVRAAMPGFIARKLCPNLIFVPPDFKKYTHFCDLTRNVFCRYDPNFLPTSLDEAYLDITAVCQEKACGAGEIAEEVRATVLEETGLTCSAGAGPNRMLAKVCSDINKPNGQFVLPNDRSAVMTFVSSLPVRKVGGVGKVTEHILREVLGINTCQDLLCRSTHLCALFSNCSADFFLSVGLGLGGVLPPKLRMRKSISCEKTFASTRDEAILFQKLADLAEDLSNDMDKEGLHGRTLTLKVKTESFEVRSRCTTSHKYICSREDILDHASKLLKSELPSSLRLIGLRMSHFMDENIDPAQKTLNDFVIRRKSSFKSLDDEYSQDSRSEDICHIREKDELNGMLEVAGSCVASGTVCSSDFELADAQLCCTTMDSDHSCNMAKCFTTYEMITQVVTDDSTIAPRDPSDGGLKKNCEDGYFCQKSEMGIADKSTDFSYIGQDVSCKNTSVPIWIDDYKCSFCGFELPPSFIEERRDHCDHHLAMVLQEEESKQSAVRVSQKSRFERTCHRSNADKERKRPRNDNNLTIEFFFVKGVKNAASS